MVLLDVGEGQAGRDVEGVEEVQGVLDLTGFVEEVEALFVTGCVEVVGGYPLDYFGSELGF